MLRRVTNIGRRKRDTDEVDSPVDDPQRPPRLTQDDERDSFSIPTLSDKRRNASPVPGTRLAGPGPLGLNVVYTPDNGHKADIIFVHGLGGTSRWSWSKNKDPELFWPLTFLPLEPDLCLARILTFGYNAAFQKSRNVGASVLDFAKDLLFDMKYGKDLNMGELEMGRVPVVFVVHSMGGLVVKEAYMQGQHDPEYEAIIKAVAAITFLSTPHRGTTLAQTLNRILDTVMVNSKQYVAELSKNSLSLQKLNEQFRHIAPRLQIVSFYETLPTTIGMKGPSVMVLEKDSSVLGYPGEISKALNADHHGVCKFEGPQDPNYVTVRNVLKTIISKIIARDNAKTPAPSDHKASLDLKRLLGLPELPGADYIFFRDQWTEHTHEWIVKDDRFLTWRDSPGVVRILWINGGAGTGKSILASTIVNNLTQQDRRCQFFFIRYGDRRKRTINFLLRSIAFQIGQSLPSLIPKINEIKAEDIDLESADPRIIWDRLFKTVLLRTDLNEPLYWIIDGVDESDSPRDLIKTLLDISSTTSLRILLTSRRHTEISTSLAKRSKNFGMSVIEIDRQLEDIRVHVQQELRVPGSDEVKAKVEQQIVDHSQNNFLWVRLAVEKVNRCRTLEDIEAALLELPEGMDALYDRMARSVEKLPNHRDKELARQILQCLTCSARVLKVSELSQALGEAARGILDLPSTVRELCGDFVVADNDGHVDIIHHTAREYLLTSVGSRPFTIDRLEAHRALFLSSIQCLLSTGLRAKLARGRTPDFIEYATSYWSTHLAHMSLKDEAVVRNLTKFLTGKWVLIWIHSLASSGQLKVLTQASKHLSKFVATRNEAQIAGSSVEHELLSSWSTDMMRIVGRFGNLLRRKPGSIYATIPAFCPKGSSIYQEFGKSDSLEVQGVSIERWDDLFARVFLGKSLASAVLISGSQAAVLTAPGTVRLFDASDFREAPHSPIQHGERVDRIAMSKSASLLASYGYHTTKIWNVCSGQCILSVNSIETKTRSLAMLFANNDSLLLVGTEDRRIRSISLCEPDPSWTTISEFEEDELEGHFANSASHMALSPDGTMAAIGYRGYPPSAWEVDAGSHPIHIGHCRREDPNTAVRELRSLFWHPYQPEVLGLNFEGTVFRWAPYEDEVSELPGTASKLAVSNDGELLITGDSHGRVALYATASFALLFQVSAQDAVFGLAFSPDSKRFYDLRANHLNAWEPSALMRFSEAAGRDSDSSSGFEFSHASELSLITSAAVDPITSVAGCPSGNFYCCGTQAGIVSLHNPSQGKIANLYHSVSKFAIEYVAWSGDGRHICAMDFSKQLVVFEVSEFDREVPKSKQVLSISLRSSVKGRVLHLSLQGSPSVALIQTTSQAHVVPLTAGAMTRSKDLTVPIHSWITHPNTPGLLVGVTSAEIIALDTDLVEQMRWEISWPAWSIKSDTSDCKDNLIDRVLVAPDGKHILLQASSCSDPSHTLRLLFIETAQISLQVPIENHSNGAPSTVRLRSLGTAACGDIVRALGLIKGDRLVFISSDYAVCSFQLRWTPELNASEIEENSRLTKTERAASQPMGKATGPGASGSRERASVPPDKSLKELFALPDDWANEGAVKSCVLWSGRKSLLYPRNGHVAVVKCKSLA